MDWYDDILSLFMSMPCIPLKNDSFVGAALSLGCMIGFFAGGWMSQHLGKKIMMVACNFISSIIWIMLSLRTHRVEFIIVERFLMGVISAAAITCVGEIIDAIMMHCNICISNVNREQNLLILFKAPTSRRHRIQNKERSLPLSRH